jgi:release factor glutamine methyltransferase
MILPPGPPRNLDGVLDRSDVELWRDLAAQMSAELPPLPDKPEETPDATLRALWHLAAGEPMSARLAAERSLPALGPAERQRLRALVRERLSGRPLAHMTGRQSFMGLEMLAGAQALIPRAETELLTRAATSLLQDLAASREAVVVIDVCTGSGNVAAALALAEPRATVHASDVSPTAVELARRNAAHLGIDDRLQFHVGDLLDPFFAMGLHGAVDLITCNPPYISTSRLDAMPHEIALHEPSLAFDGGPLGVQLIVRLIRQAPVLVRPGGWLALEVGDGQGPSVEARLRASGAYAETRRVADARGVVRALVARRSSMARPADGPGT